MKIYLAKLTGMVFSKTGGDRKQLGVVKITQETKHDYRDNKSISQSCKLNSFGANINPLSLSSHKLRFKSSLIVFKGWWCMAEQNYNDSYI